ncbi:MAG: non-homologous end-joining DNA ligase [Acidimicrobiia bacterium]
MKLPRYEPMLATRWPRPFTDPEWWFEVKWDGVRVLLFWDGSEVELRSRRGRDVTEVYPEVSLVRLARPAILDGEIVAFDPEGRPSFELLQSRMNLTGERRVADAARSVSVSMVAFDLLFDDEDLTRKPLETRLERLDSLDLPETLIRSDRVATDGEALFDAVKERRLEGMVGKRLGSAYRPGVRSSDWRKVAAVQRVKAVVGGFLPGEGGRTTTFSSLLLGLWVGDTLRWIGSVGTGFDNASLRAIRQTLDQLETATSPFLAPEELPPQATWVTPSLVADVEFKQWTKAGRLRAPSFKGFTLDPLEDVTWAAEGPDEEQEHLAT